MKKLISVWKLVFILLIFTLAFSSCKKHKECQHIDANDDSICDNCSDPYTDGQDVFEEHICVPEQREENRIEATCEKYGSYDLVEFCSLCNKELSRNTIVIDMLAHTESEWIVDSAASCLKSGLCHKECTECGILITEKAISALGHNYKITSQTEPTCTNDGQITFSCQRSGCDATKQQISYATGHSFGNDYTCDYCQYTESFEHTHNYISTIVAPSCTEMGYTLYECGCGDKYRDAFIDQKGHFWDEGVVSKEATCTLDGIMLYSCLDCTSSYEIEIKASHSWTENVISSADCTKDGVAEKVCTKCGEKEGVVISASHTWGSITVIKQSTCSENGIERRNCARCNYTAEFEIKTLGHKYVNGICTVCGGEFIDSVTPRPDHLEYGMYFEIDEIISNYGPDYINEYGVLLDYNENANIEKVAVYLTQDGTMWRRCIACVGTGIEYATYVPYLSYYDDIKYTGLNSNWINIFPLKENSSGIWCYNNYTTIGVNLEDKYGNLLLSLYDIGQAGTKTRVFDNLNEMIAWLLSDCDDHVAGDWIIDSAPTCTANGSRHTECTTCGETITTETIPATGHNYVDGNCANCGEQDPSAEIHQHNWSEWAPAENLSGIPVCEYEPVYTRTCYSCGQFEMETWPAPGHQFVNGYCVICLKEDPDSVHTHTWSEWQVAVHPDGPPKCELDTVYVRTCLTCGWHDTKIEPAPGHNYVDGYCTACGGIDSNYIPNHTPYEYFNFDLLSDGTYSISSNHLYTFPSNVILPATYNSIPVTQISYLKLTGVESLFISKHIATINTASIEQDDKLKSIQVDTNNTIFTSVDNCVINEETKTLVLGCNTSIIPENIEIIGADAFRYCTGLSNFTIPASVKYIEERAFFNCYKLKNIELNEGLISINSWAFYGCCVLESIYIPSTVEYIDTYTYAFCTDTVNSIQVHPDNPWFYSKNNCLIETSTQRLIQGCKNSIIPDGVKEIAGYAFQYCSLLENIFIPNSVIKIDAYGFRDCNALGTVFYGGTATGWENMEFTNTDTPNIFNANVYYYSETQPTTEGNFWHYVDGVPTVWDEYVAPETPAYSVGLEYQLSSDGTHYTVIGIGTCTDTKVVIPNTYNSLPVTEIFWGAFRYSGSVTSFIISENMTNIMIGAASMHPFGNYVTEIIVDANNPVYKSIDGNLYTKDGKTLLVYSCAKTDKSFEIPSHVTTVGLAAFFLASNLEYVVIPNSVTSIETSAFCAYNLKEVYYTGNSNGWDNIIIENSYNNNSYLTNATRYYYSETQPTEEGNFWHYVDGVPTAWPAYVAPDTHEYSVGLEYTSNGDGTCYVSGIGTCTDTDIVIPAVSPEGWKVVGIIVPEIGGFNTYTTTSISIPATVTEIDGWSIIGAEALKYIAVDENNQFFKSVDGHLFTKDGTKLIKYATANGADEYAIPYGVTTVGSYAFYSMYNNTLKSVSIPDTVRDILDGAFAYCTGIKSFEFPDGMTTLNGSMFLCCNMEYIVIPKSVTCIDGPVQLLYNHEWKIYYKGTEAEWNEVEILNPDNYFTHITSAVVYYYSEYQPTTEGNFWHYVDGEPTVWENHTEHIHFYDTFRHVLTPSCTAEGCYHMVCECGNYEIHTIPMTNHNYTNGICTYCGTPDPDYVPEAPAYSVGLEYTSNGDGTCSVSGIGTCTDTDIVIPATSPTGDKVIKIAQHAFLFCDFVEIIVIPEGVTTIAMESFANCPSIKTIIIPSSVTDIGYDTHYGCPKLDSVIIAEENNHYKSINGSIYTKDGSTLTKYNVAGSETSLVIPSSVTRIENYALDGFVKLETLIIPDNVLFMGTHAVSNCQNLKKVFIGNGITCIDMDAFSRCVSLTSVEIGDKVTYIADYAFSGCSALEEIVIPRSVNTIGCYAFDNCSNLECIYYKGDVEEWAQIFIDGYGNSCLLSAIVCYYSETQPTTEGNFWHYVDGVPTIWPAYVAPETPNYSVGLEYTSNGDGTCYVSGIGTCEDQNLLIPPKSPEGYIVVAIGQSAFSSSSCVSVTIPDSVTHIGDYAFSWCQSLSSVTLGAGTESLGRGVFGWCNALKEIAVAQSNETFKSVDGNLYTKDGKTLVQYAIGKSDASFNVPDGVKKIGDSSFYGCDNLISISFPDSVTEIGQFVFYMSQSLTSVTFGNNITTIGYEAFYGCYAISSIDLPDSVVSIGEEAFLWCTSLYYVILGNNITNIENNAFYMCDHLTYVYYKGTVNDWQQINIGNDYDSNSYLISATRYYYSETAPTTEGNFWHYVDGEPTIW